MGAQKLDFQMPKVELKPTRYKIVLMDGPKSKKLQEGIMSRGFFKFQKQFKRKPSNFKFEPTSIESTEQKFHIPQHSLNLQDSTQSKV